ncbi:hypothetical protein JCM11641_007162 [Rhodosporidiobolus odoratus]
MPRYSTASASDTDNPLPSQIHSPLISPHPSTSNLQSYDFGTLALHSTTTNNDDDDEDEDEEAWDEVDIPHAVHAAGSNGSQAVQAAAEAAAAGDGIEVVISKGGAKGKGKGKAKNPGQTMQERMIRQSRHKVHVLSLLGVALVRNKWCNDPEFQARLLSQVPSPLLTAFTSITRTAYPNPRDRSRLFDRALQDLVSWFYRAWEQLPEKNLRRREVDEVDEELKAWEEEYEKLDRRRKKGKGKADAQEEGAEGYKKWPWEEETQLSEAKRNKALAAQRASSSSSSAPTSFVRPYASPFPSGGPSAWEPFAPASPTASTKCPPTLYLAAAQMRGSQDLMAMAFVALLRAVDVPARLVCSLQGVEWRSKSGSGSGSRGSKAKGKGKGKAKGKGKGTQAKGAVKGKGKPEESEDESEEEEDAALVKGKKGNSTAKKGTIPSKTNGARKATLKSASKPSASASASSRSTAKPLTTKPQPNEIFLSSSASASDTDDSFVDGQGKLKYKVPKPTLRRGVSSKAKVAGWKKEMELRRSASPDTEQLATPPSTWIEAYTRYNKEWITVDASRKRMRCRGVMEPKGKQRGEGNLLAYVVGFEEDGSAHEITPRYAHAFTNTTLKLRVPTSSKARKENDGKDWFGGLVAGLGRGYQLNRDKEEQEELWKFQRNEPFPSSLGGFKGHPNYVLESHLHRDEALRPSSKPLGLFKGTHQVYRRSDVLLVKSQENWYRIGRSVRSDEIPRKWVKQRAVTINNRRKEEMNKMEGGEAQEQGLFEEAQTEVYRAPPVVDGKIPKNDFGNIDLFVPSMLPAGAVHLPNKVAAKCAKQLEMDYAEAITGFEFRQRRALPTIAGVVIAEENAEALREAILTLEQSTLEKEFAKQQDRVLKRWKKLVQGLRIRQRLLDQFGDPDQATEEAKKEAKKAAGTSASGAGKSGKGGKGGKKGEKQKATGSTTSTRKRATPKRPASGSPLSSPSLSDDCEDSAARQPPRKRIASASSTGAGTPTTTRSTSSRHAASLSGSTPAPEQSEGRSLRVRLKVSARPDAEETQREDERAGEARRRSTRASAVKARGRLKLDNPDEDEDVDEFDDVDVTKAGVVEGEDAAVEDGEGYEAEMEDVEALLSPLPPPLTTAQEAERQPGGSIPDFGESGCEGGGFVVEPDGTAGEGVGLIPVDDDGQAGGGFIVEPADGGGGGFIPEAEEMEELQEDDKDEDFEFEYESD